MALIGVERSAWKLQPAIANTWAQLRGAVLILNLLLYFICPVSAVAALPQHHPRGPPYSSPTIVRLPKWHTSFIANSSLSTWGSTLTSGSRLVTMFSVGATQGRPSSSQFHGFLSASHRPHNINTLPVSANLTHRRHSTEFISPSPSRHLNFSDQEVTKTRHSTDITSSIRLSSNSTQASHGASSGHYSVSNISRLSSLGRNTTRANDIVKADASLVKPSSIPPRVSSVRLPSSPSSGSHPPMTPLHTSSSPTLSGSSSFPSKTQFTLPPASSSTTSNQSSLAAITPKPSTPNPSVTSGLSSSTNELPFPLPPGCKLTVYENETYVLIPTERARKVPQQRPSPSRIPQAGADGYDNGPSPSTTSQAGAEGYDHSVDIPKDKPFDKKIIDDGPGVKISAITLGLLVGMVPTALAIPILWGGFDWFKKQKQKEADKNKKGPQNPVEEAQDMCETIKKGKWTKRLSSWLKAIYKDWDEYLDSTSKPPKIPRWPNAGQKLMLQRMLQTYQGPTSPDDFRRLEEPFERDPGSCNYNSHRESQGCLEPPENWPRPTANEGEPERLTHEESLDSAERLPRARETLGVQGGIPWKILKVPEGYARLTLDGKIAYLGQNKLKNGDRLEVNDPRIRYYDNRCAAVGPGNSPLGGKDVDKLWRDEDGKLTLNGKVLGKESDIMQQYDSIQSENGRFVRQNFPSSKFEGGRPGSKYSSDPPADDSSGGDDSPVEDDGQGVQGPPYMMSGALQDEPSNGDSGKGKGKAKATSIEALEDGLTLAQKTAMDMQMDHDLLKVSDQIIKDWWDKKYKYVGPSQPPPADYMRKLYWSQNNGKGPGPGDYDDWGNEIPEELPQTNEIESPSNSNSDSEQTDNGKPSDSEDAKDEQDAKAKEEAMRDQIRKIDEALREEERARQEEDKRMRESEAREAIREQIRKADEAMKEEGKAREEEARIMKEEEEIEALRESVRKGDQAMKELREARARAKAREEAIERARQERKNDGKRGKNGKSDGKTDKADGKGNRKGDKSGKTNRGNGGE